MYNVIQQIINHTWITNSGLQGDQSYIYYICGSVIIILTVVFIDLIYRLFRNIIR